jgi:hypothetical protein
MGQLSRFFDKMTDALKASTTSIDNLNIEIDVECASEYFKLNV